jgi:mRNA-degrading endonuclease toxin of MazEF toxin-antitoxin module
MKRGDVILADFPFFDRPGNKRRPAVVVQADKRKNSGESELRSRSPELLCF